MPSQAHKLTRILVPDFDDVLRSCLDPQPLSIFKLQAVAMSHGHRFRKVEKDFVAFIRGQANAAAMALIEIERNGANCFLLRPIASRAMNQGAMRRHIST